MQIRLRNSVCFSCCHGLEIPVGNAFRILYTVERSSAYRRKISCNSSVFSCLYFCGIIPGILETAGQIACTDGGSFRSGNSCGLDNSFNGYRLMVINSRNRIDSVFTGCKRFTICFNSKTAVLQITVINCNAEFKIFSFNNR